MSVSVYVRVRVSDSIGEPQIIYPRVRVLGLALGLVVGLVLL